jgi:hypothetical protein
VWRHLPQFEALQHVIDMVDAFLDASLSFSSVSSAATRGSVELLRRVVVREEQRWVAAKCSSTFLRSYKQEQFADAMNIAAANGMLGVAKWLCDEYFPGGVMPTDAPVLAAKRGYVDIVEWLSDTHPERQSSLNAWTLCFVVAAGHFEVVKWWWENHDRKAFTPDTMNTAAGIGHLEMLQYLHSQAKYPISHCSTRAMDWAPKMDTLM